MACTLLLAGCGKEAAPQPPVVRVAERTTDLQAIQEGLTAVLRWSYPAATTAGQSLTDVEGVEVWRAVLPRGQEPPPPVTARDRQLQQQLLESQGEILTTLDPQALASATRGRQLVYRDDLSGFADSTEEDGGSVVWYGVRTVCCRGRPSELSNVARMLPSNPPPPPTALRLLPGPDGIDISWDQPPELLALVERSPDGSTWSQITDEPIRGDSYRDESAEQGRAWSYRVRSVARPEGGGRVVGEPSQPARVEHPDAYPPPTPDEVVCLPEGGQVRVRWESVPGATSYRVSRRLADGAEKVLADGLGAMEFIDEAPPLGDLHYLVVAEDEAGNASEPNVCAVVMGAVP